ncbi:MAG: hypothetical protein MMC23_003275 [Stictis urceolatum]|nr:hypothetical protein [Stictis urceolata]
MSAIMGSLSFENAGTTVLKPKHLAHIVLRTQGTQFKKMVDFYKTFLNASAAYENDYLSFLSYDHEHHRIAIAAFPNTGPKPPGVSGLAHVAFTFDNLRDLMMAYRQRKAHGIVPVWNVLHGPTISMYYRDPDGNDIETQVDVYDTPEEATAYMNSEEFAKNPIGVEFDPEDIIRRIEAGKDEAELVKRPAGGKAATPSLY